MGRPAPPVRNSDYALKKYPFINKYSFTLLQSLKWPEEILLFFSSNQEAMKVLNVLFPNPELVEAAKMEIRATVMPFADIDWKFQSTLKGFKCFPSKPLKHFVTTNDKSRKLHKPKEKLEDHGNFENAISRGGFKDLA